MTQSDLRIALITGAGSGVGRATAVTLAQAGYGVALASRTAAQLEETRRLVHERAGPAAVCDVIPTDVSDAGAVQELARRTLERLGRVDVLANVAGYASLTPIEDITPEHWRRTIDTNLTSAVLLTAALWPAFQRQGAGLIVNVSSMASIDPFPHFSMYAAAKAGLNMFTHCTAQEGKAIGVQAVALALGAVETPMLRGLFDESMVPPVMALDPQTVADVIRDLAIGKRSFKSGETMVLASP